LPQDIEDIQVEGQLHVHKDSVGHVLDCITIIFYSYCKFYCVIQLIFLNFVIKTKEWSGKQFAMYINLTGIQDILQQTNPSVFLTQETSIPGFT
jgi:hypothetical protein